MSSISPKSKSDLADQYSAQQAEKDQLRAEHEKDMERLGKAYSEEKQSTQDRFETSMQSERLQTYDNLRNAKKRFSSEEKNLTAAGTARIRQKGDEYAQEETRITQEGQKRVDTANRKQAALEEYQRSQANAAEALARSNTSRSAQSIMRDSEQKIEKLRSDKMETLDKRRAEHGVAVEEIRSYYDGKQDQLLTQHEKETQRIEAGVNAQINLANLENSKRLDAHLQKQDDPFYRMAHIDSDFQDLGEFYQLKVRLPEHERKGFRVQVSGQELQFSGMRSTNQKAELEPGHDADTHSYQSFAERYKFDTPVDSRGMQTSKEGEWLIYTIPKYGANHRMREENAHQKISKHDLELSRDLDFKDTLPVPQSVKSKDMGTLS